MANKPDEFEKTLNELDTELDNIQKCAQEIFQKIDHSFSYPYPINSVSTELNVLLSAIQHFEKRAKNSGVACLTTASIDVKTTISPNDSGSTKLNIMIEEKKVSIDELHQESNRIIGNARAALSFD